MPHPEVKGFVMGGCQAHLVINPFLFILAAATGHWGFALFSTVCWFVALYMYLEARKW